jgi:hypothetical protein
MPAFAAIAMCSAFAVQSSRDTSVVTASQSVGSKRTRSAAAKVSWLLEVAALFLAVNHSCISAVYLCVHVLLVLLRITGAGAR